VWKEKGALEGKGKGEGEGEEMEMVMEMERKGEEVGKIFFHICIYMSYILCV